MNLNPSYSLTRQPLSIIFERMNNVNLYNLAAGFVFGVSIIIGGIYYFKPISLDECHHLLPSDSLFIQQNSSFIRVRSDHKLRIIYKQHKLGTNVPLVIFIHGLGGNAQQWDEQCTHFAPMASILAIDFVGHGKSDRCSNWEHYKTVNIADEIAEVVSTQFCQHKELIWVAHSYGCCLTTSILSRHSNIKSNTKAVTFLAPKAELTEKDIKAFQLLLRTPDFVVDLVRKYDRKGGINSHSVQRTLSNKTTSIDLRNRQLAWNQSNITPIVKRCAAGLAWVSESDYRHLTIPVLLMAGEDDAITPIDNVERLFTIICQISPLTPEPFVLSNTGHNLMCEKPDEVSAFISSFLVEECKIDSISLKDQILRESQAVVFEKWSLKNYAKWSRIANVSEPIGRTKLRGMKVLKQDDPIHSTKKFVQDYPHVGGIIDISLDDHPPYEPADFESTQIEYIKLPTMSKVPPLPTEVKVFIDNVKAFFQRKPDAELAVHCHYGFNRTGFMISSYLIEVEHYTVSEAISAFAQARPPGIKHLHFKDALYTRYEAPLSKLHSRVAHKQAVEETRGLQRALSDLDL